jgi:hypothetical protein
MKAWYREHPGYHAAQMRETRKRQKGEKAMPTGHYLDDEAKRNILAEAASGATDEALAKKYKVIPGTIARIRRQKGAAQAERKPKPAEIAGNEFEMEARRLRNTGMTSVEIAKKLDVNKSKVDYHLYMKAARKRKEAAMARNGTARSTKRRKFRGAAVKATLLREKVQALREEGLGLSAVAAKLNIPRTTANYYFYQARKHNGTSSSPEGAETNGHEPLNKHIKYGIAYAETERFLSALAERLDVDAKVLRLTISGLLGRSSLRE